MVEANTPSHTGTEPVLNPLWVWIRAAVGHEVRCAGEADANGCSLNQAKVHALSSRVLTSTDLRLNPILELGHTSLAPYMP